MKTFSSKLLLFGEYTIINGSQALAIPYPPYSGHWAKAALPDERLLAFAEYLTQQAHLRAFLDVPAFQEELAAGLFFDSNIPIGYGLGSSGALCAAVYDRYAVVPIGRQEEAQFPALKQQFSLMESHFHGSSSGTDPLICYLDHPVLIRPGSTIERVILPIITDVPFHFFLLDTGISRSTGPLVQIYLEHCRDAAYAREIEQGLRPVVDRIIADFLKADWRAVGEGMERISRFQWEYFQEMIPSAVASIWRNGLDSGEYTLKLCGAGGGGFLLGIAREASVIEALSKQFSCQKIW